MFRKSFQLIKTISFIVNHPLNKHTKFFYLFRFLYWQIKNILKSKTLVYNFIGNSKIIVSKGLVGATGNYYCGLDEFAEMSFLLHYLRKEDCFIDIGANVGSYTILASSYIGAKSISFEPIEATYNILKQNLLINQIESNVTALKVCVGSTNTILKMTNDLDSINHIANEGETNTTIVEVKKLDNIINDTITNHLIKIDVEGYETEVLKGAKEFLNQKNVKAIIIELNGSGARYGFSDSEIHKNLLNLGFEPYRYQPFERNLIKLAKHDQNNTIYIKDIEFVQKRIITAKKICIHGISY